MIRIFIFNNKKEKVFYLYSIINDFSYIKVKGILRDIFYIVIFMRFQNRYNQQIENVIRREVFLSDDRFLILERKERIKVILIGLFVFLKVVSYMSVYFENLLICMYSYVKRILYINFIFYFKIYMFRCGYDIYVRILVVLL